MPAAQNELQELVSGATAAFTIVSGLLFFTKVFMNWPPLHGLELID
jgi:hypothetical protein